MGTFPVSRWLLDTHRGNNVVFLEIPWNMHMVIIQFCGVCDPGAKKNSHTGTFLEIEMCTSSER